MGGDDAGNDSDASNVREGYMGPTVAPSPWDFNPSFLLALCYTLEN